MEENESQNQQSDEWQGGLEPRTEIPVAPELGEVIAEPARPPKDPNTTPTGELVADYEALLAEIKVRQVNHDDNLASLDAMRAEAISAYEEGMKGASVEAAKLLVVISKRLGMPLNGAPQPAIHPLTGKPDRRLTPVSGQTSPTPCPYCGKEYMNGLGMHISMHVRRGDKKGATAPVVKVKEATRWCGTCGTAIHVKGWTAHQAAHQRHGKELSRSKVQSGRSVASYGQAMGAEKIKSLLTMLSKAQPISGSKFRDQYYGGKNVSAFLTGLKERGLAANDHNHLWTVTPKGAALLS